ncbi:chemotaxis protein CheW [Patescibacteria group bacterium]|nr:chemotaxis protein CheW [Patescibacteria group bacterium]
MTQATDSVQEVVKKVAQESQNEQEMTNDLTQVVIFELDKEEYAVLITDIKEIIPIPEITAVPNAPDYVNGIFNLRGKIVVTLDLEKRFKFTRESTNKPTHILIVETDSGTYGLTVDNVKEILRVPTDSIKNTPDLLTTKVGEDNIKGVIVLRDEARVIVLLDVIKILSIEKLSELNKITTTVTTNPKQ